MHRAALASGSVCRWGGGEGWGRMWGRQRWCECPGGWGDKGRIKRGTAFWFRSTEGQCGHTKGRLTQKSDSFVSRLFFLTGSHVTMALSKWEVTVFSEREGRLSRTSAPPQGASSVRSHNGNEEHLLEGCYTWMKEPSAFTLLVACCSCRHKRPRALCPLLSLRTLVSRPHWVGKPWTPWRAVHREEVRLPLLIRARVVSSSVLLSFLPF